MAVGQADLLQCHHARETMGELFTRSVMAAGQADLLLCQPCQPARETRRGELFTRSVRAQELCESRGGRPGLPSLISLQRMQHTY